MPVKVTIVASLAAAFLTSGCASLRAKTPSPATLHHLTKIYADRSQEDDGDTLQLPQAWADLVKRQSATWNRRYDFLEDALARYGFVVVRNPTDADATLKVSAEEWITLDAPENEPNRNRYTMTIDSASPALNWHTSLSAFTQDTRPAVERMYMEILARRLFKAWKQSAVQAGDLTPAQAKAITRIDGR